MPLDWPGVSTSGGDLEGSVKSAIKPILDRWADYVEQALGAIGLPRHASPAFRPWNLFVVVDAESVLAAFTPLTGGVAAIRWVDQQSQRLAPEVFSRDLEAQLGAPVISMVVIPKAVLGEINVDPAIMPAVARHIAEVERENRLGRLGDLTGFAHLEPFLRTFLNDHPNPDRNVFIMMRFIDTDQMNEIHRTIKGTLKERGFDGIRADDRDYTGELWSNIETYLIGCKFGIAVFEDIEKRDFNPNVSLELGHMLGRHKRCLILKEQRLPDLPVDVMHRLYKPFDVFNIASTLRSQVLRFVDVDLGFK